MSSRSTSPALSVLDGEGYQEGQEVPAAPVPSKAKSVKDDAEGPGVVYVGYVCAPLSVNLLTIGFLPYESVLITTLVIFLMASTNTKCALISLNSVQSPA